MRNSFVSTGSYWQTCSMSNSGKNMRTFLFIVPFIFCLHKQHFVPGVAEHDSFATLTKYRNLNIQEQQYIRAQHWFLQQGKEGTLECFSDMLSFWKAVLSYWMAVSSFPQYLTAVAFQECLPWHRISRQLTCWERWTFQWWPGQTEPWLSGSGTQTPHNRSPGTLGSLPCTAWSVSVERVTQDLVFVCVVWTSLTWFDDT